MKNIITSLTACLQTSSQHRILVATEAAGWQLGWADVTPYAGKVEKASKHGIMQFRFSTKDMTTLGE